VSQSEAAGALGEGWAILERLNSDERAEHGHGVARLSNQVKNLTLWVVKGDEDARRAAVEVNLFGVVEPTEGCEGKNTFEGGVAANFFVEIVG
jgi:hypothetical protein